MKLWGGRFKNNTSQLVDAYNASIGFDQILAEHDIQGSLAHVSMLGKCGILAPQAVTCITQGLQQLLAQHQQGQLTFSTDDEDIHMNIERQLQQLIGETAGKLHSGRSRNDQVALDLHLYIRKNILTTINYLCEFNKVIIELAQKNIDVIMPGYTHLQRAEPVRFSHHIMAYFHMFHRDILRLMDCFARVNINPLGAGALAGSGLDIDDMHVTELLKFDASYENSLDAVSDRDFVAEFLFNASLIMMHLSKLSEEIILWSSHEFSFIQLEDQYCTGSSMMPQKKNPDVAELARGKVGRVYGSLIGILTVLKGLPLAYNKDLQEDKEGLFDTVNTLFTTFDVYTPMLQAIQINQDKMLDAVKQDYSNATQLANYMTSKGIAFREAHKITGEIVMHCIEHHKKLADLSLSEFKHYCLMIENDIYDFIHYETVVESHKTSHGTAKSSVIQQIHRANDKISHILTWSAAKSKDLEFNL